MNQNGPPFFRVSIPLSYYCAGHLCQNGGECTPGLYPGNYSCKCRPPYAGKFCEVSRAILLEHTVFTKLICRMNLLLTVHLKQQNFYLTQSPPKKTFQIFKDFPTYFSARDSHKNHKNNHYRAMIFYYSLYISDCPPSARAKLTFF